MVKAVGLGRLVVWIFGIPFCVPRFESQTTGPQTNNYPLVELGFRESLISCYVHSLKQHSSHLPIGRLPRKERIIWTNHPFSGAMLVPGTVWSSLLSLSLSFWEVFQDGEVKQKLNGYLVQDGPLRSLQMELYTISIHGRNQMVSLGLFHPEISVELFWPTL